MPSGNCNLQKKSPSRPRMANTAYKGVGGECQVGKASEAGRGDRMCPHIFERTVTSKGPAHKPHEQSFQVKQQNMG